MKALNHFYAGLFFFTAWAMRSLVVILGFLGVMGVFMSAVLSPEPFHGLSYETWTTIAFGGSILSYAGSIIFQDLGNDLAGASGTKE